MALLIDPRLAPQLAARGLASFSSLFMDGGGEMISGHPSRDVSRFELGGWRGFLKRQHGIPWMDYLGSWWAGFGLVDRSRREWNTLLVLRQCGIACPEPLAVGRRKGRAFLLVRELEDAVDLHTYLTAHCPSKEALRSVARTLSRTLARFHAAGFTHPDLYAKHVFVRLADGAIAFIDFQRTRRLPAVAWRSRWRDLAALNASLGEQLVTEEERRRFLAAYLRESAATHLLGQAVRAVQQRTQHLLGRRKVRAMRHPSWLEPGVRQIAHLRVQYEFAAAPEDLEEAAR